MGTVQRKNCMSIKTKQNHRIVHITDTMKGKSALENATVYQKPLLASEGKEACISSA